MQVHYDFEGCENIRNAVVTTGSFDGVHVGHRAIINQINNLARSLNGESVVITFFPHPRKVLFPDTVGKELKMINTQKEKIDLFSETGLDHLIIVTFTPQFSKISAVEFIRDILVKRLHVKSVVIGFNHHFGHNMEGDFDYLHELGSFFDFSVKEIAEQEVQNETVSSTRIRKAIADGYIQKANASLNSLVQNWGRIHSAPIGYIASKSIFVQEIEEEEKLLPPPGMYAGSLHISDIADKVLVIVPDQALLQALNRFSSCLLFSTLDDLSLNNDFYRITFQKQLLNYLPDKLALDTVFSDFLEETNDLIY